jgi:putative endonuclease
MIHLKSIAVKALPSPVAGQHLSTKASGDSGEAQALAYLAARGLILVRRNFKTPGRGGGEVDLIMRTPDGCLVFVEVRKRTHATYGGAAASITAVKKQRIILAAQHFISQLPRIPPCRFDVVTLQGDAQDTRIQWLPAAFDASEGR